MGKLLFKFGFILLLLAGLCFSCQKGANFSTNPNLKLNFSADTLRFDTVFTTIGSATKQLKVYNGSSNSLVINSVQLMSGGKSGFRMNVDGVAGNTVSNVQLLHHDSLDIFLEVTINPLNSNNPLLITDSIQFKVNGNIQYVRLEAIGQDVFLWKGKTITQDTTLTGAKPFLIYDSLSVARGVTLTVTKNTQFYFHHNASLMLHGTISAAGTVQEPIVFRADRFDNILTGVSYGNLPGQWGGIYVDSLSYNNYFENVHIRNSIAGILFAPSNPQLTKATLLNTVIQNTTNDGLAATNCAITASNSLFANAGGSALKLIGGKYTFLQCTVANYMSWLIRKGVGLIIGNVTDGQRLIPLLECSFTNSIISGLNNNELEIQKTSDSQPNTADLNYLFTNCLIKVNGTNDVNFVNDVWNVDPQFENINKNNDYSYSFELTKDSPAIGIGDSSAAISVPYDLNGISRLTGANTDAGCYEYVAN